MVKALADADVGDFAVFRAKHLGEAGVSSRVADVFWFPDKSIKGNDLVVLYTTKGTSSERVAASGRTVHFYYWGKSEALWSGSNYVPVLVYASDWEMFSDSFCDNTRRIRLPGWRS